VNDFRQIFGQRILRFGSGGSRLLRSGNVEAVAFDAGVLV